ncbi:MAG: flagellar hook-basal body complex protein FliE [Ignavibacteriales bacterium]|nr:flagellar hook-basal body complex protein FliE [Ignavibacteriales bacterium]
MGIEGIAGSIKLISPENTIDKSSSPGFGNVFSDFMKQVNEDQATSSRMLNDFASGNGVEIHEVMIAGEKAKTSLDLLMEIRNKSIDMFKELSRI